MKSTFYICGALLLGATLHGADSKAFASGGVSVDFSKTYRVKKAEGKNLLFDGNFDKAKIGNSPWNQWQGHFYIHARKHEAGDKKTLTANLKPLVTQKIVTENGLKCAELSSSPAIMKYRPKGNPMLSNRLTQYIDLPEMTAPVKFQLSMKLRGKIENVPGLNGFRAFAFFKDNQKLWKSKDTRKMLNHAFKVSGSWTNVSVSFIAPQNTRKLGISLALYGCGQVFIDDVKLVSTKAADGVVGKLIPCSFLDKVFVVSQNDPAIMAFAFKNEKRTKINQPYLFLKLPDSFEVVDQRYQVSITERKNVVQAGQKYVIYKIDLRKLKNSFGKEQMNTYNLASVQILTKLAPGSKKYPAEYWYQDGKYQTTPEHISLKVIPEIEGKQPKIFQSGAMVRREGDFVGKGVKTFTDFYKKTGFNVVHGRSTPEMNAAYKQQGLLRYTQPYFLCNGYRIGRNNKPDSVKFQLADGSYCTKPHQAICPVAVYKKSPYYQNEVTKLLKQILIDKDSSDSIMPNWEPYMFDFKGCFCPNCKAEFIKHSGLSKEDVDKVWPQKVIIKYKDKWVKFRSWQHGKMCEQFEKTISKIGKSAGKDSHFIPEIAWSQLIEDSNAHFAQYDPKDYMDKLPWLEPWGPYIFYKFDEPYVYHPGIHLITFLAAKDIKTFVKKHVPNKAKRPKLIAFPHGYQLNSWVTEPEALGFETLCFFLNGWEGSIAYVFPKGYDNRWWKAMADANRRIAEYENYVFKGEKVNDAKVTLASPVPKTSFPKYWSEGGNFVQKLPSLKTASIVQSVEYKLGNKRMIAVGNFWQKSEVFVKLSVSGLAANTKYVLREPDFKRCFANPSGSAVLSSDDLKQGVMVHVGALRWAFFVVEPYSKGENYGKTISPEFMKKLLNSRMPLIKKTIQWEQKYLAAQQAQAAKENALPDYSNVKSMSNKGVSCRKVEVNGVPTVEVAWKDSKVLIDPVGGARVKSWLAGKSQLVSQEKQFGFCVDAFWWPSKAATMIIRPYKVISQSKTSNGLSITFERKLTAKDKLFLTDCVITKTYDFFPGGFKLSTKFSNKTGVEKELAFRWHNLPGLLEFHNGKGGSALLTDNAGEVVFKRIFTRKMFRYADKRDNDLEGSFNLEQAATAAKPEVTFTSIWTKVSQKAEIISAKELYGFIFWDAGKQKTTTFEPLFKKTVIAPGKSWTASMQWTEKE